MFYEGFYDFSWFEVDIFSPWIHENNKILVLYVFKGEKGENSNQENNKENPLLVLLLFTGPIILAKSMIWYTIYNFKKKINVFNLGHSSVHYVVFKIVRRFSNVSYHNHLF